MAHDAVRLADPGRLATDRPRRIAADQVARAVGAVPPGASVAFDGAGGAVRVGVAVRADGRTLRAEAVAPSPEYALCDARRALGRLARERLTHPPTQPVPAPCATPS